MFVPIKHITQLIDTYIGYVEDAKQHHDCSEEEYNEYIEQMKVVFSKQLKALETNSSNKKLIEKYKNKISNAFA